MGERRRTVGIGREDARAAGRNAVLARRVIPGALFVLGVVLSIVGLVTGSSVGALGPGFVFAAGLVKLGGSLVQLGNASQHDRDREERAREAFAQTGRWPDDPPPK